MTDPAPTALSGRPAATTGRTIATAAFIGTAIEFYDYYIYGTAAAARPPSWSHCC